jgi:hypothetical protein
MDAAVKSKALDSSLRFIFSLVHGILLLFIILFLFMLGSEPPLYVIAGVLVGASYLIGFALNALTQFMSCSSVNALQVALDSLFGPVIVGSVVGLFSVIPGMLDPILGLFPLNSSLPPHHKKAVSQAFWVFWAGVYAQAFASGYAQVC